MATLLGYLKTWRLKLSHAKTVTEAFHLHHREAKLEFKVYANGKLLPFFPVPTYLGVKLGRSLTFRQHLHVFVPRASSRPLGMGLPKTSWVKLNRLRTSVGRFYSSMYKWGLAPSPDCECAATNQTADHVISTCPIYRAPRGVAGPTVLDDNAGLIPLQTASDSIVFLDAPPY